MTDSGQVPTVGRIFRRSSRVTGSHRRGRLVGWGVSAALVATTVAPLAGGRSALADAVGDKKAQAAALAEQINADARQVEILAEQYDAAQAHVATVQQEIAAATQKLAAAQADANRDRAALASEAVLAYIHGGAVSVPSVASLHGSVDLSVEKGYFQLATGDQAQAIDQLRQSERTLRIQQQALQSAEADGRAALAAVASRRQAAQGAATAAQAALNQVRGDLVALVAQQQAQLAAQQQAEAQAKASVVAAEARLTATAAPAPAPVGAPSATASAPPAGGGQSAARSPASPASPASPTSPTTSTTNPPTLVLPPVSGRASRAIAYAQAQLGKPYQWGGAGPDSFDCSGLTMMAWDAAGVFLPHSAAGQYADLAHIPIADLQPGDLVFFGTDLHHVGIYVGGGQMIHAPQTGEVVKYSTIFWPDLQPYGGRPG